MNRLGAKLGLFLLGLLAFNLLVARFLGVLERDVDKRGYAFDKYRWEEFYQLPQGDSLAILFLGSSHAYRGIDPLLIDSLLGVNTFNLGSSGQTPLTSYHVLKNATEHIYPKMVVIDLYFYAFMEENQLANGGNNWLELQASGAKWSFLFNAFDPYEIAALTLLPILRKKNNVRYTLRKYLLGDDHLDDAGAYQGKGYVRQDSRISIEALQAESFYDQLELEEDWVLAKHEKGLKKLVAFCQEKGIEVRCISAPMPAISFQKIKDRQRVQQYLSDLTRELGIPYGDYTQNPNLGLQDELHFYDDNHLNHAGVKLWNKALIPFLSIEQ